MRKHRFSLALLLTLALLSSQWVLATHSHHEDSLNPDPECQLCKHAVQLDAFAPTLAVIQSMLFLPERRVETPAYRLYRRQPRFHNSRASPALL